MNFLKRLKPAHWVKLLLFFLGGSICTSAYAYYNNLDSGNNRPIEQETTTNIENTMGGSPIAQAKALSQQLLNQLTQAQNTNFSNNQAVNDQLNVIKSDLQNNNDLGLLNNFKKLENIAQNSKLTSGQQELLSEFMMHAQALVLTRNFAQTPGLSGPVSNAIQALQAKDSSAVVSNLQTIASKGKLTQVQHDLITAMLGDYGQHFEKASEIGGQISDSVDSIQSLF